MTVTFPRLIGTAQAAVILQVHPNTVRKASRDGRLTDYRTPGGHRRYSETEVWDLFDHGPQRQRVA